MQSVGAMKRVALFSQARLATSENGALERGRSAGTIRQRFGCNPIANAKLLSVCLCVRAGELSGWQASRRTTDSERRTVSGGREAASPFGAPVTKARQSGRFRANNK